MEQAGLSDLEIISQPVEDENQYLAPPVQLVSFGYRDLPLAALDLSLAGSQLLSNADDDENRDGTVGLSVITPLPPSAHYRIDLPFKQTAVISFLK
ncbi:Transmembrane protein 266 [Dissostichus eleginoides]|uniref:Transmembrane protein 266 n=1 Tax=Dissostichus eleginoides TaxID=100907 RepID=A0AAD9BYM0_DISEL|nr:Transmembrane protein 266 [Dissostichus eleginoides]